MQHQIDSRFRALDSYVVLCQTKDLPEEVQAQLCRYGAVLVCGTVERCIEIIILTRLSNRAHPKVLNFIKSHFKRGRNLDCGAIAELLTRFDSDWAEKFSKFVERNSDVKEGLSSCYALRNAVAHGNGGSLALKRLVELIGLSRRLIEGVVTSTV